MSRPRLILAERYQRRIARSKRDRLEQTAALMRSTYLTPRRRAALEVWAQRKGRRMTTNGEAQ